MNMERKSFELCTFPAFKVHSTWYILFHGNLLDFTSVHKFDDCFQFLPSYILENDNGMRTWIVKEQILEKWTTG